MLALDTPFGARVAGHAAGGRVALAACCDVAIAVDIARIGIVEVRIGVPPDGVAALLAHRLGPRALAGAFLVADMMPAARAAESPGWSTWPCPRPSWTGPSPARRRPGAGRASGVGPNQADAPRRVPPDPSSGPRCWRRRPPAAGARRWPWPRRRFRSGSRRSARRGTASGPSCCQCTPPHDAAGAAGGDDTASRG
ncbi:MAG: hypothetical protein GEV08_19130 [Acidimicrobiia bacterium]|nr:hypothetical protein [Acidimicrobiia bacterium]